MENTLEYVKKYTPYIYFDENEPFLPEMIGYTIFNKSENSPSFNRKIEVGRKGIVCAIEYAIYWDYDITHLYDLEHYWVFIGEDGRIVDAQGSFHGKYISVLMKDRSNIIDHTHVKIYSQPGKHAFAPLPMLFDYIPDIERSTYEDAGADGLVVIEKIARGRYNTTDEINRAVKSYMQKYKFKASNKYTKFYNIEDIPLVEWRELDEKIPEFIAAELEKIVFYLLNI